MSAADEASTYALLNTGRELLEEGKFRRAVRVLERARKSEPRKGSILEPLGRAYYLGRDYRKAYRCFKQALEIDPTNDYAHYCMGLCCLKLDRHEKAGGHFKMAWSLKPCEIYREKAFRFGAPGEDGGPAG